MLRHSSTRWNITLRRLHKYPSSSIFPLHNRKEQIQERKKLSEVTCYKCGEMGHYANNCQQIAANPNVSTPKKIVSLRVNTSNSSSSISGLTHGRQPRPLSEVTSHKSGERVTNGASTSKEIGDWRSDRWEFGDPKKNGLNLNSQFSIPKKVTGLRENATTKVEPCEMNAANPNVSARNKPSGWVTPMEPRYSAKKSAKNYVPKSFTGYLAETIDSPEPIENGARPKPFERKSLGNKGIASLVQERKKLAEITCYKCGEMGHYANNCQKIAANPNVSTFNKNVNMHMNASASVSGLTNWRQPRPPSIFPKAPCYPEEENSANIVENFTPPKPLEGNRTGDSDLTKNENIESNNEKLWKNVINRRTFKIGLTGYYLHLTQFLENDIRFFRIHEYSLELGKTRSIRMEIPVAKRMVEVLKEAFEFALKCEWDLPPGVEGKPDELLFTKSFIGTIHCIVEDKQEEVEQEYEVRVKFTKNLEDEPQFGDKNFQILVKEKNDEIHVVKVRSAGAGKLIRQMEEMLFEYDELKLDEPSGSQKSTMVERESQEADDGVEDDDNWKELEEESDELCSKIR